MRISEILSPHRVWVAGPGELNDRAAVLTELAELLAPAAGLSSATIATQLTAREELQSTAIGSGVAVPHARSSEFGQRLGALILARDGVPFDANGEPAQIILGVIGPAEDTKGHLQLLTNVARLLRNATVRRSLVEAEDGQEAYGLISAAEA